MVFTVGADPNWQQDKLARLMQALDLARARRDKKRQEKEIRATNQFKLIMSAAETNPDALKSPTVRDFVTKNSSVIPGLHEWYELETASLDDPANPRNAYEKLLRGADSFAANVNAASTAPSPAGIAATAARSVLRAKPEIAFESSVAQLSPSEQVRARQHAAKIGAEIPLTDSSEPNKKISGPLYVLHNAHLFREEEVRAARIALQLEDPRTNPDEKISGAMYVLEHPGQFQADTVRAAQYQLEIAKPPQEPKSPSDKVSGTLAVLNDPKSYSPEVVRYARALSKQAERSGAGGGSDSPERTVSEEKGRLTEGQSAQEIEEQLESLYGQFEAAGPRRLTPVQQRRAAKMYRNEEDVDTFIFNAMFPPESGSIDKIINFHLQQPAVRDLLKRRSEDPRARAAKLRSDALAQIRALTKSGMNAAAARAKVFMDLLQGL